MVFVTACYVCLENIFEVSKLVYDLLTARAVKTEQEANVESKDPLRLISVNGTWKQQGFSFLFGVITLRQVFEESP